MFRFFLLCILLFSFNHADSKTITSNEKAIALCHVWGLLKYNHAYVNQGKVDWNQEFINQYESLDKFESQSEFDIHLLGWINSFGIVDGRKFNRKGQANLFVKNENWEWIENSNFSSDLVTKLQVIKNSVHAGNFYASVNKLTGFVSFENEKGISEFDVKKESHRLLYLASFWNAMNYWNVNIYLTDVPWETTLVKMITEYKHATTESQFEIARLKLASALNDSHANYLSRYFYNSMLSRYAAFGGKIINDSLVVTLIHNSDFAAKDGIKVGDVITKINGENVSAKISYFRNLTSNSNNNHLLAWLESQYLLSDNKDSLQIEKISNGKLVNSQYIHLYDFAKVKKVTTQSNIFPLEDGKDWTIMADNIAYVNLKNISQREISLMFSSIKNTKGLVIDLRNYPTQSINFSKYIFPEKIKFIDVLMPFRSSLGISNGQSGLKIIKDPFSTGSRNSKYYKGKIVLLVDRHTASKAEYIAMSIQQAPNVITIGEQTAGAVMNIVEFQMADQSKIGFTGMGAFYPNGNEVQRNGIRIDKQIENSALYYDSSKYLKEAIKILNN